MADVLQVLETQVLAEEGADTVIVDEIRETQVLELADETVLVEQHTQIEIMAVAEQGPPGPPGDASGALLIGNRLSELAGDTTAQQQAQQNIGLGGVDPLAHYILAKS